jgi:hypothetical protein
MGCHLGCYFTVDCPLRRGRGELIQKRGLWSNKTIQETKILSPYSMFASPRIKFVSLLHVCISTYQVCLPTPCLHPHISSLSLCLHPHISGLLPTPCLHPYISNCLPTLLVCPPFFYHVCSLSPHVSFLLIRFVSLFARFLFNFVSPLSMCPPYLSSLSPCYPCLLQGVIFDPKLKHPSHSPSENDSSSDELF